MTYPFRLAEKCGSVAEASREPIDAVYLWVDGTAPGFTCPLSDCKETPPREAAGPPRFRDNGELRYSLRSLELNAPWIRNVYLVTNGQVPQWLRPNSLEVIPHTAIFPDASHLPTWNSLAIELHLHRIPGLSERFLYFNDDMFLGRPVSREDFIDSGGAQRLYFDGHRLPDDLAHPHPLGRSCARTQQLLDRLHGPQADRPWPSHAPRLLDRRVLQRIEDLLPEEFQDTSSHHFRNGSDFQLWIFYQFYLLEAPGERGRHTAVIHRAPGPDYAFFMMQEPFTNLLKAFALLAEWRPRFFCVNDDLDDAAADHPAFAALRGLLDALFSTPSRFEKTVSGYQAAS